MTKTTKDGWGGGVAPTLNVMDNTGDKRATVVVAIQGNAIGRQPQHGPGGKGYSEEGDPMFTLTKLDQHGVATPATVRRLTPTAVSYTHLTLPTILRV